MWISEVIENNISSRFPARWCELSTTDIYESSEAMCFYEIEFYNEHPAPILALLADELILFPTPH